MKRQWQIVGYVAIAIVAALVTQQSLVRKVVAAPKASAAVPLAQGNAPDGVTDARSLASAALREGIDYYPNAGKVVRVE